jgi:hypothetical protein
MQTAWMRPDAGSVSAAGTFIDATIIRAVLLSASMRLLGDWNWDLGTNRSICARAMPQERPTKLALRQFLRWQLRQASPHALGHDDVLFPFVARKCLLERRRGIA